MQRHIFYRLTKAFYKRLQRFFSFGRLGSRHQRCQNFAGFRSLSHQQMPQKAFVRQFVKKVRALFCKIRQHCRENPPVILIHQLAAAYRNNIIKAAPLVHTQRKRTILHLISKRKFHFIAVLIYLGALLDSLPQIRLLSACKHTVEQLLYLLRLHFCLLFIRHGQISTTAAQAKMGTRTAGFQR